MFFRGFSPAGYWPQSEERLCTLSGQSDRSVKLVSPVCARLTCEGLGILHSALCTLQVSQTGQSNWFHQCALDLLVRSVRGETLHVF